MNVSEAVLPFACWTMAMVCSASSEDGVCLFGVAGPGTGFLSLRRERGETLPFWRCLCGFFPPSAYLRRDLPAWHPLSFCLPCVGSQGTTYVSLSPISWEETDPGGLERCTSLLLGGVLQDENELLLKSIKCSVYPISTLGDAFHSPITWAKKLNHHLSSFLPYTSFIIKST